MRTVVLLCCAIVVLAGVGIGLWFVAMPYPASMWFEYRFKDHYSDTMPMSRADFEEMMDAAGEMLSWRELIVSVEDVEEDRATVCTIESMGGTSDVSTRILMRKVRGAWRVEQSTLIRDIRGAIGFWGRPSQKPPPDIETRDAAIHTWIDNLVIEDWGQDDTDPPLER